jgi:hypothetical protein
MALPGININYQNGQLGQFIDVPDGVFGLLASAAAVASTFALNTPYQVRGMADVAALGITPSVDNYRLYKTLSEFFAEAGEGTELWLMGFARSTKVSDWFTADAGTSKAPAHKLLDAANGKLSMLFTSFFPDGDYEVTLEDGIDADVWSAMQKAQTLADDYTASKYAPFYVLFEGYAYDGNKVTLKDLTELSYNRCQVLLGDTEMRTGTPASNGAAVGILAGRKAKSQVHVNPGKVMDGPLANIKAYILDVPAEQSDITALHDKGYVSFRTHTGKAGYYFTDDRMACQPDDDYHYGTNRRVIDKAYRQTYIALVDFLLDDNTVNNDGTISGIYAKTVEGRVIQTLYNTMTANNELSFNPNDPNDRGVICKVDLNHNVTSTSQLKIAQLQVKPKGYNRSISVPLGYVPVTTNN